jgi:hypothetical protein
MVRAVGPEYGRDKVDVDAFADVGSQLLVPLVVASSRGSRPAVGRPEGLALTPVVVESGAEDNGSGPARRAGPTCPPLGGPWMLVGTVGGLASFLAGARSGNPIGSGAWGHTFVTPARLG